MKIAIRIKTFHRLLPALTALAIMSSLLTSCGDPDLFSISGQISSSGAGLSGVTMTLKGANSTTTTTDGSGNYTFSGLAKGSYTITPNKTGFTFSPTNSAQTIESADITAINFTATSVSTFSIFGTLSSGGTGLSGVTMMLTGAGSATTATDVNGTYIFTGLANGNYSIMPNKTGFTFSPPNTSLTINGADITAINYTATAVSTFSIFGSVSSGGAGLSGVTMTRTGSGSATLNTDANGTYIFAGLANGDYTITPSKTGFTFAPTSAIQTINGSNILAVNFTATSTQMQIVACPSSGTTTNVAIQDFLFAPSPATVSVNGIVKWTNNGPSLHTVTSGTTPNIDGKFNSGNLAVGTNLCVQFMASGSYPYFSTTDPSMTGNITVQ